MKWKRTVGQRLRHMTPLQAADALIRIRTRGFTIDQPTVRALTGGHCGQSINLYVARKLAEKAGALVTREGAVREFDATEQAD